MYTPTHPYICIRGAGETDGRTGERRREPNSCMHGLNNKIRGNTKLLYVIPKEQTEGAGAGEVGTEGTVQGREQGLHTLTVSMYSDLLYSSSPNSMAASFPSKLRNLSIAQSDQDSSGFRLPVHFRYPRPGLSSTARLSTRQPDAMARRSPSTPAQSERRF